MLVGFAKAGYDCRALEVLGGGSFSGPGAAGADPGDAAARNNDVLSRFETFGKHVQHPRVLEQQVTRLAPQGDLDQVPPHGHLGACVEC